MKRTHLIARIAAGVAVIAGVATAFALPAGADVGIMSPPMAGVQVGSPATLVAKGAATSVPVTVICMPYYYGPNTGDLSVEVTQRNGGAIASGSASVNGIPCTGTFQTINVVVPAAGEPFRKGTAVAYARFTVCEYWGGGCLTGTDQREIEIVR